MRQFVVFCIDNNNYCLDINDVNEIIPYKDTSQVPESQSFIEGIINLRGSVIAILNLRKRLSLPPIPYDENFKFLIIKYNTGNVGILVDSVTEIIKIPEEKIKYEGDFLEESYKNFSSGLIQTENSNIYLLDIDKLFSYEDIKV